MPVQELYTIYLYKEKFVLLLLYTINNDCMIT